MTNLKRILAATDLSAPARHAVDRAGLLASETGASLCLSHVARQAPLERLRQLVGAAEVDIGREILQQLHESLRAEGEAVHRRYGVAPSLALASGELLPSLLAHVDTLPADLLVVGARGSGFLRHILLGSTAERLLRTARCPVLVVRQTPHEAYRRVLVTVDFSPVSRRALRLAAALAPRATLSVMHAFEVPFEGQLRYAGVDQARIEHYRALAAREARAQLDRLIREAGLGQRQIASLVVHGNASERILAEEQESDCDLIVVGKHGGDVFEELLLGGITKHILAESPGDVLVAT